MSSSLPPPDPTTTIQRILFLSPTVHIYTVPPLTSTKGYTTTSWTPLLAPPTPSNRTPTPITTRLRVLETSSSSSSDHKNSNNTITITILLEDPSSGDLFAAAPYTAPSVIEPVLDSARFFAVRVEGEGGRKAVLGIGFEERSEAIDFGICLQEARKVLMMMGAGTAVKEPGNGGAAGRKGGGGGGVVGKGVGGETGKREWGLKEGEMIKVEIGGMGVKRNELGADSGGGAKMAGEALFSIKPPPGNAGEMPLLPPPPSAREIKEERRRSRGPVVPEKGSAAELGFDDGEFGEFQ